MIKFMHLFLFAYGLIPAGPVLLDFKTRLLSVDVTGKDRFAPPRLRNYGKAAVPALGCVCVSDTYEIHGHISIIVGMPFDHGHAFVVSRWWLRPADVWPYRQR